MLRGGFPADGSFNPRAPRGARREWSPGWYGSVVFQSTRPARGATLWRWRCLSRCAVSIHAPRAGRDAVVLLTAAVEYGFNPRAPRGARRKARSNGRTRHGFNPRAPRGARRMRLGVLKSGLVFQSTRPARGATCVCSRTRSIARVSIHAPRAGRDRIYSTSAMPTSPFQSTRPARGATFRLQSNHQCQWFQSTRPARGATTWLRHVARCATGFNPRAPRGARPVSVHTVTRPHWFQSTRPARGATHNRLLCGWWSSVSIHAPRAGRDAGLSLGLPVRAVSIHAPRAGRDTRI